MEDLHGKTHRYYLILNEKQHCKLLEAGLLPDYGVKAERNKAEKLENGKFSR